MKPIRLLALTAMIVAGLAAPMAAAATEPAREMPLRLETLGSACTVINGSYVVDRSASACEIGDGAFVCADHCEFQVTALGDLPPLQADCVLSRGTFREVIRTEWACEIRDNTIVVKCPLELEPSARLLPWKLRRSFMVCAVKWIPSEQPMT